MRLRHPLTGAVYTRRDDGLVEVEPDGRSGCFHPDGRHHSGELREADFHLLGWVGGPLESRQAPRGASPRTGSPAPVAARPPPALSSGRNDPNARRTGMDLGLAGRRALVTAASRGIGLAIARMLADEGAHVAICARGAGGLESARKDLEARGVRVFARSVDVADGDALHAGRRRNVLLLEIAAHCDAELHAFHGLLRASQSRRRWEQRVGARA